MFVYVINVIKNKMSKIIELTPGNFKEEVLESKVLVLVDFWAPWCGPCRQMEPTLDKIAEEELIKVAKVNASDEVNSSLVEEYGISNIPVMKIFSKGEVIKEFIGLRNIESLKEEIKDIVTPEEAKE